jgi:porin
MAGLMRLLMPGPVTWLVVALTAGWSTTSVAQSQPAPSPWDGTLLGNLGGVRAALGNYGISLGLQNTSEVFDNPTGGCAQGTAFDGQKMLSLGIDLNKAIGLERGIFNVSALQNYGHGVSAPSTSIISISSAASRRSVRRGFLNSSISRASSAASRMFG